MSNFVHTWSNVVGGKTEDFPCDWWSFVPARVAAAVCGTLDGTSGIPTVSTCVLLRYCVGFVFFVLCGSGTLNQSGKTRLKTEMIL